jgi:hypothetical protein
LIRRFRGRFIVIRFLNIAIGQTVFKAWKFRIASFFAV